jgi:hypothetical protein
MISASLDAWLRPSSNSQPKTRIMIRYRRRRDTNRDPAPTCSSSQTAAQAPAPSSEAVHGGLPGEEPDLSQPFKVDLGRAAVIAEALRECGYPDCAAGARTADAQARAAALLPAPPPQPEGTARTPAAATSQPRQAGYAARHADAPVPGEGLPGPHRSREKLDGGWLVRQVQAEAVRFSVLAQAAGRRSFRRHLFWRSRPPCDVTRELRLRGQTGLPSLR